MVNMPLSFFLYLYEINVGMSALTYTDIGRHIL